MLGPGLVDWPSAVAVLERAPFVHAFPRCPCRRSCRPPSADELGGSSGWHSRWVLRRSPVRDDDPSDLPTVFTSSSGDGHNCHELCEVLAAKTGACRQPAFTTRFTMQRRDTGVSRRVRKLLQCPVCVRCKFRRGVVGSHDPGAVDQTRVLCWSTMHRIRTAAYEAAYSGRLRCRAGACPDTQGCVFARATDRCVQRRSRDRMRNRRVRRVALLNPGGAQSAPFVSTGRGQTCLVIIDYLDVSLLSPGDFPLRLDRRWIQDHIPHQDGMCLLDEVLGWGATRTECRTSTHRALDNPLRARPTRCRVRYRIRRSNHGGTRGTECRPHSAAPAGLLASVRGVQIMLTDLMTLRVIW